MTIDESFFRKVTLWGSIVIGVLCYCMFAYLFYISITKQGGSVLGAMFFLVIGVNCTHRIRSYFKIEQLRKNAISEEEVAKAERRAGIVNSIFSNATIGFYMLLMSLIFLLNDQKYGFYFMAFCAFLALCFIGLSVISLRNLKRFDRL